MLVEGLHFAIAIAKADLMKIWYFCHLSLHRRDRIYNERAGFLFDVSGGLTIAGPILSRAYAKLVGEYTRFRLHRGAVTDVETRQVAILQQDQAGLETLIKGSSQETPNWRTNLIFDNNPKGPG